MCQNFMLLLTFSPPCKNHLGSCAALELTAGKFWPVGPHGACPGLQGRFGGGHQSGFKSWSATESVPSLSDGRIGVIQPLSEWVREVKDVDRRAP